MTRQGVVGLRKCDYTGPSLHSTSVSRPHAGKLSRTLPPGQRSLARVEGDEGNGRSTFKIPAEPALDEEPLSTEDESFNGIVRTADSSDEEVPTSTADIPRTAVGLRTAACRKVKRKLSDVDFRPVRIGEKKLSSPTRPKTNKMADVAGTPEENIGSSQGQYGSHFTDDHGFLKSSQASAKRGYGSSQRKAPTARMYGTSSTPRSPVGKFKHPVAPISNSSSPSTPEPKIKFHVAQSIISPKSDSEGFSFKKSNMSAAADDHDTTPDKLPDFSKYKYDSSDEEDAGTSFITHGISTELAGMDEPCLPGIVKAKEATEEHDATQKLSVIFRARSFMDEVGRNGELHLSDRSGLQITSASAVIDGPELDGAAIAPLLSEMPHATCPMCRERVDPIFLKSYNNGKRMNTQTQARFCQAHTKMSAKNEWEAQGYPTVDWSGLSARIQQHNVQLKKLLDGAPSYYRNVLEDVVKSGKIRTLKQSIMSDNISLPGYYGSRGLQVMSENIMQKFSPQLRRIAVKDRLVSAQGVSGYVHSVLVPELAIMLICEDMKVEPEEARTIMKDSAAMGNLINEVIEDVVVHRDEADENDTTSRFA